MKELYDRLIEYEKSDGVPYAEGKMKDAQKFAATVCQADETYFLVNGSRGGILSAVFSATKQGGELLIRWKWWKRHLRNIRMQKR